MTKKNSEAESKEEKRRKRTMKEIGNANGYSRETARRKLLKAVKICREKNKIQIWFVYIEMDSDICVGYMEKIYL